MPALYISTNHRILIRDMNTSCICGSIATQALPSICQRSKTFFPNCRLAARPIINSSFLVSKLCNNSDCCSCDPFVLFLNPALRRAYTHAYCPHILISWFPSSSQKIREGTHTHAHTCAHTHTHTQAYWPSLVSPDQVPLGHLSPSLFLSASLSLSSPFLSPSPSPSPPLST
jgi:hypothetical protein